MLSAPLVVILFNVCSQGIDCKPINPEGPCFTPNTVRDHASFAMNSYYHAKGLIDYSCDFSGTARITTTDPSKLFLSVYIKK
ncbi:major pollen allergen ole e 10 [Phtheirospermum japonicum]|uniref:Major pollen allergen ole e 10 n=1 Tax=Phtheirospermum japonicum TaxID=374723 RepID=A0A830BWK4_9LAMI|nr:major pollen allergen ole e 10 [Phtheirospermum japonicum]